MRHRLIAAAIAALLVSAPAQAQDAVKFKFSHWVIPSHPVSKWIQSWADDLRAKSDGKIDIQVFPSMQLGGPAEHYDMVRRGTVDMAWILHGYTSDRFPLTTLFDIPFTVDDGVVASKVIDHPELRSKYLDREARGVKNLVLFTNQPAHLFTANKAVRVPADLNGQRIRFPSTTARRFIEELGATPIGLPMPAMAENLQKGVVDGTITDYGAVGIAFKLAGLVKHATELKATVVTFALIINPDSYAKLKGPLKEMFDKSIQGQGGHLGELMDSIDEPGKNIAVKAGLQIVKPNKDEMAQFHAIGAKVGKEVLDAREKAGHPAKAAYALIRKLAAETKR